MKRKQEKNWLEWLVLTGATLLVFTTIGFLLYDAITTKHTPPSIVVSLGQPEQKEDHVAIPLTAKNGGAQTAEDIRIEVVFGQGRQQERGLVEFPYLPGQSTVTGWVTFTKAPDNTEALQIRVLGYSTP